MDGSFLTYSTNLFVIYFAAFERCSRRIYWMLGWKGMAGYLGIPCILETVCVSHETTWEMRVCKEMIEPSLTVLLSHSSAIWLLFGRHFPVYGVRERDSVLRTPLCLRRRHLVSPASQNIYTCLSSDSTSYADIDGICCCSG